MPRLLSDLSLQNLPTPQKAIQRSRRRRPDKRRHADIKTAEKQKLVVGGASGNLLSSKTAVKHLEICCNSAADYKKYLSFPVEPMSQVLCPRDHGQISSALRRYLCSCVVAKNTRTSRLSRKSHEGRQSMRISDSSAAPPFKQRRTVRSHGRRERDKPLV